jgi:hypothetical protein
MEENGRLKLPSETKNLRVEVGMKENRSPTTALEVIICNCTVSFY